GRRLLRAGLLRADGRGARAPDGRPAGGALAAARLVALRRVHRGLPGQDPAARAAARPAPRPRRGAGRTLVRATRLHALVVRLGAAGGLRGLALPRPARAAARRSRRPGARVGAGAGAAAARAEALPRPQPPRLTGKPTLLPPFRS